MGFEEGEEEVEEFVARETGGFVEGFWGRLFLRRGWTRGKQGVEDEFECKSEGRRVRVRERERGRRRGTILSLEERRKKR